MKITQGIVALLLITGFSAHAETDNFNVSLTGTFDNTIPDDCTVSPINTIDLGTLNMHDIYENNNMFLDGAWKWYEVGVTVDINVNCTNGTNYEFTSDSFASSGNAMFVIHDGTDFIHPTSGVTISGTGTGINQRYTYNIIMGNTNSYNSITELTGAFSVSIPLTLTVL